ncbi:MAG TPA: hypothetical protein VLA64_09620 [Azonexus sp.]|nr:hypothetical protein [Azonexus sp.]
MNIEPGEGVVDFSLVKGGPFHRLLGYLRLTGPDRLPTTRAVIALVAVAWLPLAVLTVVQTMLENRQAGWGFFVDWTTYTRYGIAIGVMVATERYADGRLYLLLDHFSRARLVAKEGLPAYREALAKADRRSASALAEALILVVAFGWTTTVSHYAISIAGANWQGVLVGGKVLLSWAGSYEVSISSTLFLFLALRWLWRFLVWTTLLYAISRLPLRLMSHNPDRVAGLGFLTAFPSIFIGFTFAISCVVSSNMLKELAYKSHSPDTVWLAMAAWLVICVVWFVGPLLVFVGPLFLAQEKAMLELGRYATLHHLALGERLAADVSHEDEARCVVAPDFSLASNMNSIIQSVREQGMVPVNAGSVKQVILAAGIPMIPVILTLIPFLELVKWMFKKIV